MAVIIKSVEKRSPAAKAGIKSGDTLVSLNGNDITDVLDYRFYQTDEKIKIKFINHKGKEKEKTIKRRIRPVSEMAMDLAAIGAVL